MPQPLSSKENTLFRTVIRNYEDKQYKKGLKAAEQILKKNPKHGDTLAMKALIMNSQGKTEEAFTLGKVALQCDMKSHVCWHVYGLLYRAAKNFEEAIKAYKFALRLEPESTQIARDLALLQAQTRDYEGYLVSRRQMLQARSGMRQNWTALAVAHHLSGDYSEAESVLTTYESTMRHPPPKSDFEHSEATMYKNILIYEQGDVARAFEHLQKDGVQNLDRLAVMERKAKYLVELNRKEEAVVAYRLLIDRNPEHHAYYHNLVRTLQIDAQNEDELLALYDGYAKKYPRCDAARRIPLNFLKGDHFKKHAEQYINRLLDKGIPSTFANLRRLYNDEVKRGIIHSIVDTYLKNNQSEDTSMSKHSSTTQNKFSALYFLAQHYNYHVTRDLAKALEYIDQAIELEPKSVDCHQTKARIWKHYGDISKAREIMEHARTLDKSDRYINTKAAKYQLRNDENDLALQTLGLFTRGENVGGPLADLHDMQCMWYLTEDGMSHARQGHIGLALKRYTAVHAIFDTWYEDQFDFHQFSLRKGQIRAYVEMLKWEDHLREHPFYTRAALGAIDVYINMYDQPLTNGHVINGHGEDALERRKAAKKAKKDAQKAEREAAARKAEKAVPTKDTDADMQKKDDDPQGLKLAGTADPLVDAMKFVNHILQFSPRKIACQLAGFEVYIRRERHLLALKCLLAAAAIDRSHPTVHEQSIRFCRAMEDYNTEAEAINALIKEEVADLTTSTNLTQANDTFLLEHRSAPAHIIAGLRTRRLLSPESTSQCEQDVIGILDLPAITMEDALNGLHLLEVWKSKHTDAYKRKAAGKWIHATAFGGVKT